MKIDLNHVGIHKKLELDLPDSGLVLLKGPSGVGKSTILHSIEDALFGTVNQKPRGLNVPTVINLEMSVQGNSLVITRTRNSDTLRVLFNNIEYIDLEAQSEIEKIIGMNHTEFMASSFIMQDGEGSLLYLGPTDMRSFIQGLVSKKDDPDKYKRAILDYISEKETELAILSSERSSILSNIESIKSEIGSLIVIEKVDFNEQDMNDNKDLLSKSETEYESISKQESDLLSKYNNPKYKDLDLLEKLRDSKNEKESKVNNEVIELNEKISEIPKPWSQRSKESVIEEMNKIKKKGDYLHIKSDIFALASRVYSLLPESKDSKNLTEFLDSKIGFLNQTLLDIRDDYNKKINEIELLKKHKDIKTCPYCLNGLRIINDDLVKSDAPIEDVDSKIQEIQDYLSKDIYQEENSIKKMLSILNDIKISATNLKAQLGEDPYPELKPADMSKLMEDLSEYNNQQVKNELLISELTHTKDILTNSIDHISKEVSNLEEKVKDYNLESRDVIEKNISTIKEQKKDLYEKIKSIRCLLDGQSSKQKEAIKYRNYVEKHELLSKKLSESNEKLNNNEKLLSDKKEDIANAKRIKDIRDYSASASIESMTETINQNAKIFIDSLFSSDGTKVSIEAFSKTQKGEDRSKFNVNISHKGCQVKSLKRDLSGGEKSRIMLSFQLGLSEIYSSPILMIDEGFKGLGMEDKYKCLQSVKTISDRKLVIIIEHNIDESLFDEVISI